MDYRVCVAPMVSYTTPHFRYLARLMGPHARLYTEMVVADALIHNPSGRYLDYNVAEHPVALQLAGSEPVALAQAAHQAADAGFDEINLNIGCPSPKVQKGGFGACLMQSPQLVASCIEAMRQVVSVPVTAKIRLGVDALDRYEDVYQFVETVAAAGCSVFMVHARKAWLSGLNTKQNREVPPLRYDWVYRLKQAFPELTIVINGGITEVAMVRQHLQHVDGVMLGRVLLNHLGLLSELERAVFGSQQDLSLGVIFSQYVLYMEQQLLAGIPWRPLLHPLMVMFQGCPGAKRWRRHLNALGCLPGNVVSGLQQLQTVFSECCSMNHEQAVAS